MADQRQTKQKLIIRRFLNANKDKEMTVAQMAKQLEIAGSGIGIATIYRSVRMLEEEGVLTKVVHGSTNKTVYRYAEPDSTIRSIHKIFCTSCGKAIDLPYNNIDRFERKLSDQLGFAITDHQILFYGICENCK